MELIQCENDTTAKVTHKTCIARQRILDKGNGKTGWSAVQYRDCEQFCSGCKTGLKFYKQFLKGELSMEEQTKTCPCGVVITRAKSQNAVSWHRTKYCPEHSAMNSYQRDKLFKTAVESLAAPKIEKQDKTGTPTPTTTEKPIISGKIEGKPKKEIKMKFCTGANSCGGEFPATLEYFQAGKEGPGSLDYLCKSCRNKMRRGYRAQRKNALAIEISTFPGLLDKLKVEADKNLRTPENQALWMLKEALIV